MDIIQHIKNNSSWWLQALAVSFIINLMFPTIMYPHKSFMYNLITMSFGDIIGGLILFVIVCLILKLFKKNLNEDQIKLTFFLCFSFWWILQILNHFNI